MFKYKFVCLKVGFDAGDQTNSYAHPLSRQSSISTVADGSNCNGRAGRYVFRVHDTEITANENGRFYD